MLSIRKGAAVAAAVIAVVVAVGLLTIPVPEGFQEPLCLKVLLLGWKTVTVTAHLVGRTFGIDYGYMFIKQSFSMIPRGFQTYNVQTVETQFGGVPVRVYLPAGWPAGGPGVVFIHGGGWYFSSVDATDCLCRRLAQGTNAVYVSIEYRLTPEHPYPAPLDDCVAATVHFIQHAHQYGVDPTRIAIAGDSAGGNLAAAVTLRLRDRGFQPQLKLQLLLYPPLQALDFNTPSYQRYANDPIVSRDNMAGFWLMYARGTAANRTTFSHNLHTTLDVKRKFYSTVLDHRHIPDAMIHADYIPNELTLGDEATWNTVKDVFLDPYFAPLMADDVTNLPPAFILGVENDVLRDDGVLYAHHLKEAGNRVKYTHVITGYHGLISYPFSFKETEATMDMVIAYLNEKL